MLEHLVAIKGDIDEEFLNSMECYIVVIKKEL